MVHRPDLESDSGPECQTDDGPIRIRDIRHIDAPNVYISRPIVRMVLDLGAFHRTLTSALPGFPEALTAALPSLYSHHCSPGVPGGFLMRVREGTLLGHVAEHTAIELLSLAGMPAAFGKTRQAGESTCYHVVFEAPLPRSGILAGRLAVELVNGLLTGCGASASDSVSAIREEMAAEHRVAPPTRPHARTPVLALTGAAEVLAAAELICHCLFHAGRRVGVWTGGRVSSRLSGAVTGTPRDLPETPGLDLCLVIMDHPAILASGLPYGTADAGIWVSRPEPDAGEGDAEALPSMEETAWTEALVIEQIDPGGCAVLNADMPRIMAFHDRARGRVVLFSEDPANRYLRCHLYRGGAGVVRRGGEIRILGRGREERVLAKEEAARLLGDWCITPAPLLACIGGLYGYGMSTGTLAEALRTPADRGGDAPPAR